MKDSEIKFCPMLTGQEEVKALTIGRGDYVVPTLRVCMQENCVAFDGSKKWCNHYHSPVEYMTKSEDKK